jgi:hypothetical protein
LLIMLSIGLCDSFDKVPNHSLKGRDMIRLLLSFCCVLSF